MIKLRNVSFTYPDGTQALHGLSLSVDESEFFGFLGPNGAGKTTTIKMLVSLLRPDEGTIKVGGYDLEKNSRAVRSLIGYTAQEASLDPELTARENLELMCEAYHVPRAVRDARVEEVLKLVDLTDAGDQHVRGFSGGMENRLAVASCLVHEPPLIILDEPTTGLDPEVRIRLWDYFESINEQGTTIFLTTQNMEEADRLCSRIALVDDGTVVDTGTPEQLKSQIGNDKIEVSLADTTGENSDHLQQVVKDAMGSGVIGDIEIDSDGFTVIPSDTTPMGTDLLIALENEGYTPTEYRVRSPSLDDVFLSLTGTAFEEAHEEDNTVADSRRQRGD